MWQVINSEGQKCEIEAEMIVSGKKFQDSIMIRNAKAKKGSHHSTKHHIDLLTAVPPSVEIAVKRNTT